ncbi:hypothetical protein BDZ97DRAFT_1812194 [Flammula alnicola]|nr:hypothetical protein BDZ97DRAFT_1812194 [Flammula alnicola]
MPACISLPSRRSASGYVLGCRGCTSTHSFKSRYPKQAFSARGRLLAAVQQLCHGISIRVLARIRHYGQHHKPTEGSSCPCSRGQRLGEYRFSERAEVYGAQGRYRTPHRSRLFGGSLGPSHQRRRCRTPAFRIRAHVWYAGPCQTSSPRLDASVLFHHHTAMLSRHVRVPSSSSKLLRLLKAPSEPSIGVISLFKHPKTSSRSCYHQLSTITSSRRQTVLFTSRNLSDDLSVRTQRPPDSLPGPDAETPPEIPDQEWEIRTVSTSTPSANVNFLEHHILQDDEEAIYSPNIRLSYTPPLELPSPFPKTFHIEGIQLYLASSSFIRHTMNALYSDLRVELTKLVRKISREKNILLRQSVKGIARVSGKPGQWEIESTYTFSPVTGLIQQHIVNSIHPAPHQAVYDSLRLSLGSCWD